MSEALQPGWNRPRTAVAHATRPFPLPSWLFIATIAVLFAVSGGLLWIAGLNYDGLSGNPAAKIHPSTYMLLLVLGWTALASGNPLDYTGQIIGRRPASLFLIFCTLILFVAIAARHAPGLAGTVDTFIGASVVVILLADADQATVRRIEILIHVLMAINAAMALVEFASDHRWLPYRFEGEVFPNDHRSSALQGHPLTNASLTACYVLALMAGGRLSVLPHLRIALVALQAAALVTFGGRSALVVALLLGAMQVVGAVLRLLKSDRIPLVGAAAAALLLTFLPVVIAALAYAGFFSALIERFGSDGGSAQARVQMFDLFTQIPLRDLIIGPDPTFVDSIRRVEGLEWGIENPIVQLVLYNGVVLTALMTVAVGFYLYELVRVSGRGTLMPMLSFVILINTAESIGSKTTIMTKFAVLILCLFPRTGNR